MQDGRDTIPPKLVIFSDIDGTLIDHDTYSYAAARDCLAVLRQHDIPLILASSKTAAEIIPFRQELGFSASPAICENGAGLIEGGAAVRIPGNDYREIRRLLDTVPADLRAQFLGFGDMTTEQVVAATGLTVEAAERARRRDFSEPGVWSGNAAQKERFLQALGRAGVRATAGGRFLTLSFGATKADRMAEVMARYPGAVSVALGDAPNDAEMISAADHGVIVANPGHKPLPVLPVEAEGRIVRTKKTGPEGWSTAVMRLLSELNLTGRD